MGTSLIHPTAIVSPEASLGDNVEIGPFTIVHGNVRISGDSTIESFCEIGYPANDPGSHEMLEIGSHSRIRSHSVLYEGSRFGDGLVTGHRVTVREGTKAGRNLQIGTLGDIQGHCQIGDYVRLHSNVHIGQQSVIGSYVWIFPYVVLTNDKHPPSEILNGVTLEDYVVIATMSVVLPGVRIKEGALVGAHSSVSKDVEANSVVAGSPAKFICETHEIKFKDDAGTSAYPWRRHFHRGYPPEAVLEWISEFS